MFALVFLQLNTSNIHDLLYLAFAMYLRVGTNSLFRIAVLLLSSWTLSSLPKPTRITNTSFSFLHFVIEDMLECSNMLISYFQQILDRKVVFDCCQLHYYYSIRICSIEGFHRRKRGLPICKNLFYIMIRELNS